MSDRCTRMNALRHTYRCNEIFVYAFLRFHLGVEQGERFLFRGARSVFGARTRTAHDAYEQKDKGKLHDAENARKGIAEKGRDFWNCVKERQEVKDYRHISVFLSISLRD